MCASINSRRHGVARERPVPTVWVGVAPSCDRGQTLRPNRTASKFRLQMDSGDGDERNQRALSL